MIPHANVFRSAIKRHFEFLKQTDTLVELYSRAIPLPEDRGLLLPVCELHWRDETLIAQLANWRDRNQFAYPTRFPVTIDGTRKWLRHHLLDVEDRLLFLVLNRYGHAIGHLGFASCDNDQAQAEIDNVVRGVEGQRGLMSSAMTTVIDWMEEQFLAERIYLRVLSDNHRAIEFYRNLGFVETSRTPLVKIESGESVRLQPLTESGGVVDAHFVMMDYQGDSAKREALGTELILTAGPSVSARESSYVFDAARNGWNSQWSKYLTQFEDEFARRCNVKYAMATSSCTGAMHLALLALGIVPGDEVIVPDLTWVATASAVCHVGATPVFADVDPETACIDPDGIERLITPATKAIMPVHLYGHPARMDRIGDIARHHGLHVVEDAAPSIGAQFQGRPTGSFGDFSCFSFQGAKLMVTGEGGMLLTDDQDLLKRAKKIGDHGRCPGSFWIDELGTKYKMSNLQAAFGLGQLQRIDELVAAKRRIFSWYQRDLQGVPGIKLLREQPDAKSAYWMTSMLVLAHAGTDRDTLRQKLRHRQIDTRPFFPSISQYPFWPGKHDAQPNARLIGEQGMNLPSGVCLKRSEVAYVCRTIRELLLTQPLKLGPHEFIDVSTIDTP